MIDGSGPWRTFGNYLQSVAVHDRALELFDKGGKLKKIAIMSMALLAVVVSASDLQKSDHAGPPARRKRCVDRPRHTEKTTGTCTDSIGEKVF